MQFDLLQICVIIRNKIENIREYYLARGLLQLIMPLCKPTYHSIEIPESISYLFFSLCTQDQLPGTSLLLMYISYFTETDTLCLHN